MTIIYDYYCFHAKLYPVIAFFHEINCWNIILTFFTKFLTITYTVSPRIIVHALIFEDALNLKNKGMRL